MAPRHGAWRALVPLCVARPPLSAGAIRCWRVGMGRTQAAIDAGAELGLPLWLLGCREPSDASEDFNANVATTLLAQAARDDACQLLGYVANQAVVHESAELYDPHDVGCTPRPASSRPRLGCTWAAVQACW